MILPTRINDRSKPGDRRTWDPVRHIFSVKLAPGEFYATDQNELITTVLGSCVSACVRDPVAQIGGMNHFMLPGAIDCGTPVAPEDNTTPRYGRYAMDGLIDELLRLGAQRERLEVKLFGGARVLAAIRSNDIGQRNIECAKRYADTFGPPIAAEDLGGMAARKIQFFPLSGKVLVKSLPQTVANEIVERDRCYENACIAGAHKQREPVT